MAGWDQKLCTAAKEGKINEVELSVRNGANLECRDELGGSTPLMLAAGGGHLEVLMYLVSQGSQLEATDTMDEKTALHYAARNGWIDVTKWLIDQGCSPWVKTKQGQTPFDMVTIESYDSDVEKRKKKEVMNFLKTVMLETPEEYNKKKQSNRLTGKGTYKSFDMRCMVTGQFATGKSSLVKLLVGDIIPEGRHPTDGMALHEGLCGLDVQTREWILINPETYNAMDVVYNKVLMTSREEKEPHPKKKLDQHQASETSPSRSKDDEMDNPGVLLQQAQDMPFPSKTSDNLSNQPPAALTLSPKASSILPLSRQQLKQKMKAKMTVVEIRRKMEKVIKSGKYKMKVGRLIFWDFSGLYAYFTTHQTFMTYRALFIVVFDGSKGLHEQVPDVLCFPGQHMTLTPAVFLQHWVNCILTYCKAVYTGIPKILFVATHKDKVPQEDIETRRAELYNGVEELFKDHEGREHLVIDNQIFVNATDNTDPEIDVLKKAITDLTFQHPCWGESMPNAYVPLELEIANLVAKGKQVLSLREVEELNSISKVSVLSNEELRDFLQFHHSLGKLVYFDTPQLKGYVIISLLLLVEVMRSFVTDIAFWPKKGLIRNTFERMSGSGIIQRKDLYLIWEKKHFNKISPYKEFIFDMLIHLDILSEQRRYDTSTGSRLPVENFFVPCMLTQTNDTRFMTHECTPEKAISLAFVFKGTIIPPALPNRLISACLSMWTVKTYEGKQLLFSGFIGLSFDKAHDIVVCVEGNKILLYIVHETSNGLIVPDIATGIKECMYTTLERISEFYKSTVQATSISQKLPFHIEYACSRLECHIPEKAAFTTDEWICYKHKIVHTKEKWNIWNQDQAKEECEVDCQGLQEGALNQIPTDIELLRFASRYEETVVLELAIHLGITLHEWEKLRSDYEFVDIVKYRVLVTWREKYSGRFSSIAKALQDMDLTTHTLCQVRRIRKGHIDISEEYMDQIPTDELLDNLAHVICVLSFQLGIELGLPITSIDIIQYNNGRDLVAQCKDILFQWREDQRVKPTIRVLVQALVNVGRGAECLEEIIKTFGVKKYIPFMEGKFKTFLKKLNPFQKKIPIDSLKMESESLLHRIERMEPDDFKMFIAKGEYESFENRVYLAGACNVGKSCLASILIGEKISKKWISTNGLTIYFGRNGIHLKDKKMVTLVKSDTNIMKKLLLGNPNIALKEEKNVEKQRNFNKETTDHKDSALKSSELKTVDKEFEKKQENKSPSKTKDENPTVPSLTENVKTNLPSYPQMHPKHKALTIQSDILEEIRTGEYKIRIAPSDLVDFGGQRCFDMTHQLFIQHKGTFVLMFDGRYELHKPLDKYPQGETGKDILVHWVNSILVYCKEDDDQLPMIMFAATHSDLLEMDEMLAKERTFKLELSKLFSTHVKNKHILYNKVFFINATNSKDLQIEQIKEKLVDIAFQQSTWGQRMPISWVPLELQISEMRTNNFSIIQKETIQELNRLNDEFSMPEDLIDKFLKIQHSLGKILYFNIKGLDQFIVVQPTVMVNILRSFITDKMFWPEQQDLRSILENTAKTGTIKKLQLFKLWSQPPFDVYLPTDQHKEYILNVLAHLDILVQPKHESKVKTSDPLYMVPSVVKTKLPVNLFPSEEQKTICLSYYLKECAIPTALTFKLIAAAVIIWPLKEIDGRPCLFFKSAVLDIDDNNELLIAIKDRKVIFYLTNKISWHFISPDVAASIQECMTSALQRVLHFYHECFGQTSIKINEVSLFEIELGLICNQEPCLVSVADAKCKESWICENNQIKHDTKHCLYWIFEKQTNTCSKECKGLDAGTLSLRPNDKHLVRIAKEIPITIFDQFIIHLGLTREKWEEIEYQFLAKEGALGSKLMAMNELQNIKEIEDQPVIFKDLSDALKEMDRPHSLCQILREDTKLIDTASSTLQEIPSDEILRKLPNELGNCTIQLGLELGLSFPRIQKAMSNNSKDMYKQLYDILNEWKKASKSRPSVLNLMKALQQTQSGGLKFLQDQYKPN